MKNRGTIEKLLILFVFAVIALGFSACTKGYELTNQNSFDEYEVIDIDGCEYIMYSSSYGYLQVTHKGDCSNPIHCQNGGNVVLHTTNRVDE